MKVNLFNIKQRYQIDGKITTLERQLAINARKLARISTTHFKLNSRLDIQIALSEKWLTYRAKKLGSPHWADKSHLWLKWVKPWPTIGEPTDKETEDIIKLDIKAIRGPIGHPHSPICVCGGRQGPSMGNSRQNWRERGTNLANCYTMSQKLYGYEYLYIEEVERFIECGPLDID
jgi:hypothetical protein